jgi:SAM-dependent methyltransferase
LVTSTTSTTDLADPNTLRAQLVALAGTDRNVLVVGSGEGGVAADLAAVGCTVAELATLEADSSSAPRSEPGSFDVVVLQDGLGSVDDPASVVVAAAALLAPGGRLVATAPNAAHGSARLALLLGHWPGTGGRRPFTHESFAQLLEHSGLAVETLRATVADPLDAGVQLEERLLPSEVVEWVRDQAHALELDYVAAASPLAPGEERPPRPAIEPVVPAARARRTDSHTEAHLDRRELEHRLLTQRDHIIGLEANLSTSEFRAADAMVRAKNAERKFRTLRKDQEAQASGQPQQQGGGGGGGGRGRRGGVRQLTDRVRPGRQDDDE